MGEFHKMFERVRYSAN